MKMISIDCKHSRDLPVSTVMFDYFNKSRGISQPDLQNVKRVLFGHYERDSTVSFANKELEKQFAYQSKKWNFDFINEKTLDPKGKYVWKPIVKKQHAKRKYSSDEEECDASELYFDPDTMCTKHTESKEKQDDQRDDQCNKVVGVQRLMTDYLLVRKRSSTEPAKKSSTSSSSVKKSRLAAS